MSHVTELNVEITLDKNNPNYVLHHVETLITEAEPTNKELAEMVRNEYEFVKELLGFKPSVIKIDAGKVGGTFFS